MQEENLMEERINKEKKKTKVLTILVLVLILIICGGLIYYFLVLKDDNDENNSSLNAEYKISGNELDDFDIAFLKLENEKENVIYSPLSIKYALKMLADGTKGETKEQIINVLGKYQTTKYENTENMSFANALFVKDSVKNNINQNYINTIKTNYNAQVIYDSFSSPNNLNSWIEKNTFNLINNLYDDISDFNYILVNALAIDMDWVNVIQSDNTRNLYYPHENCSTLINEGYKNLKFEGMSYGVNSLLIGSLVNKYDIINEIGEENIRKTVTDAYNEWFAESSYNLPEEDFDAYLDQYIEEISKNYGKIITSTDFKYYVNDEVKAFSKDLKEYNGRILEYIAVMPTNDSLSNYINNLDKTELNNIINSLKSIEINDYKEGVVTEIYGYIPVYEYSYEFDLIKDLKKLGITDVFDQEKADLSNLSNLEGSTIIDARHKANIDFSNEGIKAAAVTSFAETTTAISFNYKFDVPVETIDLTFNKPYLYLIRDKDSKEIWFIGTVYEPTEYGNEY